MISRSILTRSFPLYAQQISFIQKRSNSDIANHFNSLKDKLVQFTEASKVMYAEMKFSRAVSKKIKSSTAVTRDEWNRHIHFKRDIIRVSPVIFVSFLPLIGYFAISLAFAFPRQLLVHQFWTQQERVKFLKTAYHDDQYPHIKSLQDLLTSMKSSELEMFFGSPNSYTNLFDQQDRNLEFISLFVSTIGELNKKNINSFAGTLALENLSHTHLALLCTIWDVPSLHFIPKTYFPSSILRKFLKKRYSELLVDDQLIANENTLQSLSFFELLLASYYRALPNLNFDNQADEKEVLLKNLQQWVKFTQMRYGATNGSIPVSLFLHLPILFSSNEKNKL